MPNKFHFSFLLLLAFSVVAFLAIACTNATPTNPPITSTGSYPAPALGIVIDKNLQVLLIIRGSTAEQLKIQKGDHLLSINGVTLTLPKQARDLFYKSKQPIKLVLKRNGQSIPLTIPTTMQPRPSSKAPIPTVTPVPPDLTYF